MPIAFSLDIDPEIVELVQEASFLYPTHKEPQSHPELILLGVCPDALGRQRAAAAKRVMKLQTQKASNERHSVRTLWAFIPLIAYAVPFPFECILDEVHAGRKVTHIS
jgi:hypothetical protein